MKKEYERDIWGTMEDEDRMNEWIAENRGWCYFYNEIGCIWKALAITAVVMCLGFAVIFSRI